jgi:hypothetical protein
VKRRLRKAIEFGLPIVGMLIVFGSLLFVPSTLLQIQVFVVLIGVLILEAGVWGLTTGILPNERRYLSLREEGDHFLVLIRALNKAAVEKNRKRQASSEEFREAVSLMHASVERMASVAGDEREDQREDEKEEHEAAARRPDEASPGRAVKTTEGRRYVDTADTGRFSGSSEREPQT